MLVKNKILSLHYKDHLIEISYFIHLGDATTILFLHGLGSGKDAFLGSIQDEKINKHTLVGFDFPGHGDSKYITKFDINDLVEITNLVIELLGLKNFILVGHSMGGLIGLLYLKNNIHSIKAFINVEGNLTKNDCKFSGYIASLDGKAFTQEFGDSKAMHDLSPSIVEYSKNGNLLKLFCFLSIPKLFIFGENSGISYIEELKNNKIQTINISQSGHHPFDTNPVEFYGVIENYIVDNNL